MISLLDWYITISVVVILCADIIRRIYNFRSLLSEKMVLLELIPPVLSLKTPRSTEQLLKMLAEIGSNRSFKDRILGRAGTLSLEVVSSRDVGIRFIARVASPDIDTFKRQISAYLPEVKFHEVLDYIEPILDSGQSVHLMEFRLAQHYAYPLANHDQLSQHDPVAYIVGSLTQLAADELIVYQIVLSPITPREVRRIRSKLIFNQDPNLHQRNRPLFFRGALYFVAILLRLVELIFDTMALMVRTTDKLTMNKFYDRLSRENQSIRVSEYQEFLDGVRDKLAQPLFQTSIRVMMATNDSGRAAQRSEDIRVALASFGVPGYQALVAKGWILGKPFYAYRLWSLRHRLPSPYLYQSCVLSAAEVASLYHFPYGGQSMAENMARSHSRTLVAPAALKHRADEGMLDVILGENYHHGSSTHIGLTETERQRHIYMIGGTGNGKTTMLQYGIVQDMLNGKGVAVIDPHGDMAEILLRHVPANREKDVVYFNPDDLEYPIGLNLLELTPGLTGSALLREKDLITESVISIFRKIFSTDGSGGHRIEYILRNTVQTALTTENPTLFTVFDLLNDPTYRRTVTKTLRDERLKNFWDNELGKAGNMQKVKMAAGITAKIGRFLFSASARQILEQPTSTIDFEDIINSGKILICNFSKGLIGEDTAELFGITVLAKLQLASLRRARIDRTQRRPFYLYIDEFQNFATQSFVQMLSESRKYGLFIVMAEQSTSQQADHQMVDIILANVGTVICFRTGSPQDERLLLPLFRPYIEQGEISNLPAYNFYAKLSAIDAQEPFSGMTKQLHGMGSEDVASRVIALSRASFAKKQQSSSVSTAVILSDEPQQIDVVASVQLPDS